MLLTHATGPACFKAHPVLLHSRQWFIDAVDKFVDMFKVFGHLSCKNHVNDGLPKCSIFVPGKRGKSGESALSECRGGGWNEMTVWQTAWRGVWMVSPLWLQWERGWMNALFTVSEGTRTCELFFTWGFKSDYSSNVENAHTSIGCTLMHICNCFII